MATKQNVFVCELCGNVVEVLRTGAGVLNCCGQPMTRQTENTTDAATEKHVPVVEKVDGKLLVKVGSVPHPMDEAHLIEWVEVVFGNVVARKELKPGDAPELTFCLPDGPAVVRAYCNLHGLWQTEV